MTLIFFIYGLAFFSMGMALLFESERTPLLAEAAVLRPLVIFALIHGAHEWIEMFMGDPDWLPVANSAAIGWLRITLLTASFVSLLIFGLSMLRPLPLLQNGASNAEAGSSQGLRRKRLAAMAGYVALVFVVGLLLSARSNLGLAPLDASIRYALAVPGAAIAGIALWNQVDHGNRRGLARMSKSLRWAGLGFLVYACTQAVVPPVDLFPGNILNTETFRSITGIPVQLVRAGAAILITVCMLQIISVVERERQRQFLMAQEERISALNQLHEELLMRETMRQELMRRIVLAQEDERARIARELHDETSQTLTAFSLHLAALRSLVSEELRERIDLLQVLSRQMSMGIYRLVRDLRPVQLDDLGLVSALKAVASEDQKQLGLRVDLRVNGERQRFAPVVETVLFRVVQEALTNVARHSRTDHAEVMLDYQPGCVQAVIEDEGVGFDLSGRAAVNGLGLAGMRERVQSVGGTLELTSMPGSGTRVIVTVPAENIEN